MRIKLPDIYRSAKRVYDRDDGWRDHTNVKIFQRVHIGYDTTEKVTAVEMDQACRCEWLDNRIEPGSQAGEQAKGNIVRSQPL